MKRLLALGLILPLLAGCESVTMTPYVSPRITGRVVAADTHLPLSDVKVTVGKPTGDVRSTTPAKGGEMLQRPTPVQTDQTGHFLLDSQRVLSPFSGSGWFSVTLTFERAGYERFFTNYSRLNLKTNTWNGEPVLHAGDIPLQPAPR